MKLNHLILVICTGILVGFSACKKDPFTEADAIAAQKELITMKYGYELQLKNIEAAIQKAKDDAAILMKNLEIKGASDLQKQKAADEIAYLLAKLNAERQDYIARQVAIDSLTRIFVARNNKEKADSLALAAYLASAEVYNGTVRFMSNTTGRALAGVKVKIFKFDASGYFTATSNAEGYIYIKGERFVPGQDMTVVGPNSSSEIFPIAYYNVGCWLPESSSQTIYLNSYSLDELESITGEVYAALDLTNNANDGAGAGILVSAKTTVGDEGDLPTDTTSVTLEFATSTLSDGTFEVSVADGSAIDGYTVTIPKTLNAYQTAYTMGEGDNEYQTLPTKSDSLSVTLQTGVTGWDNSVLGYFMTLPNSDNPKGYSATLTDPLGILPYSLNLVAEESAVYRTPDGESTPDSSISSFRFDVDGFRLNNGWLNLAPSKDVNIYYNLPIDEITPDSSYEDPKSTNDLNIGGVGLTISAYEWIYSLDVNQRTAIRVQRVSNASAADDAVITPTVAQDTTYTMDTLDVSLVDLTGFLVEDAPELSAIVFSVDGGNNFDNTVGIGHLQIIELLEDASGGLFNIDAALDGDAGFTVVNYEETPDDEIGSYTTGADVGDNLIFFYGKRKSGDKIKGITPEFVVGDQAQTLGDPGFISPFDTDDAQYWDFNWGVE